MDEVLGVLGTLITSVVFKFSDSSGRYAASPCSSAFLVFFPTTPSETKPDLLWNSLTALLVLGPFIPSITPVYKPRLLRIC